MIAKKSTQSNIDYSIDGSGIEPIIGNYRNTKHQQKFITLLTY